MSRVWSPSKMKAAREALGICTPDERRAFAARLGISDRYVRDLEADGGEPPVPNVNLALRIADELGVPLDALLVHAPALPAPVSAPKSNHQAV